MGGVSVASGYATSKMPRLPAQGHSSAAAPPVPIRAPAEGALGRLALEALAAGDSPRCCQSGPSGVLPGRVHFPLQSSPIQFPGQAVLSPASTGCRCRTGALQRLGRRYLEPNPAPPTYSGYWSQINTPLLPLPTYAWSDHFSEERRAIISSQRSDDSHTIAEILTKSQTDPDHTLTSSS